MEGRREPSVAWLSPVRRSPAPSSPRASGRYVLPSQDRPGSPDPDARQDRKDERQSRVRGASGSPRERESPVKRARGGKNGVRAHRFVFTAHSAVFPAEAVNPAAEPGLHHLEDPQDEEELPPGLPGSSQDSEAGQEGSPLRQAPGGDARQIQLGDGGAGPGLPDMPPPRLGVHRELEAVLLSDKQVSASASCRLSSPPSSLFLVPFPVRCTCAWLLSYDRFACPLHSF